MGGIVVAEGVVEVTADASGVPRQVQRDIESGDGQTRAAGAGIGRSIFGGLVGAWAAVGGAQMIGDFFGGAISGASDLNETMSKSSVIFGANANEISRWGDNAAKTLGLSKNEAVAAAAGFGDMFSQIGFTGDKAAEMSKSVVQAAADLGSFSNLDTADVAERISAAFRGEYDSLQAVIPNISAARVEHEAMAMGLVQTTVDTNKLAQANTAADLAQQSYNEAVKKHGVDSIEAQRAGLALAKANDSVAAAAEGSTGEISAQAKAQAVMAIIQKDGSRAMGDFARTSSGAANQQKIMTASIEDQQAKIGAQLLPAWKGFLGFINDTAIPALSSVITWIGKNGDTLLMLGGVLAATAVTYGIVTAAMGAYKAFQIASAAANGTLTVTQWALNAAMSANPVGIIIVALGALVAAIIWVATQTTFFQDLWTGITTVVGAAWQWLWDSVLNPVFTAIGAVFSWIYNNIIVPIVTGIMLYIGIWAAIFTWLWESVLSPIFSAIGAIFNWIYQNIISPIILMIVVAIQTWGTIFNWLYNNVISPVFSAVGASFNWVWNNVISPVVNFITNAIRTVGNTVSTVFGSIGSFIGSAFQSALSVVRGPINGIISLVNGAIKGINSLHVTIPAWVPIVGGQTWGLNIPTIPMLARGSASAPDVFIAGEAGPELIVGRPGARVYPSNETRDMLGDGGGDTYNLDVTVNEAEDPLGAPERIARELRKFRKK